MNGPTEDIRDFCFFDFETRAIVAGNEGDVTKAGTARYARRSKAIILSYAIGDAKPSDIAWDGRRDLDWLDLPKEFRAFHEYAYYDKGWFAAWNTAFDRAIWNAIPSFPALSIRRTIDVMAQAVASNLPPSLEGASTALGRAGKQKDGKDLIRLFSSFDGETPVTRPLEWALFRSYAMTDVDELREVWKSTRKLPPEEWHQYHVSERINDRGMAIDLPFVEGAAALAAAAERRANKLLPGLTGNVVTAVTQAQRIAQWAYDSLVDDVTARDILTKAWEKAEDDGGIEEGELRPAKLSVSRDRISAVLAYLKAKNDKVGLTDAEEAVYTVLTIRQFGGSASPKKYSKMLLQHDGGRLKNMYVFNGAQQTGRFCVAAHTMVETPTGTKYIVDLIPGDQVISGCGRARAVTGLVFKGRETLFRIDGPRGERVEATINHRLLTRSGWRTIGECIEESSEGCGYLRESCAPVSVIEFLDPRDRPFTAPHAPYSFRYLATGTLPGGAETLAWGVSFPIETGGQEPDVRHASRTKARTSAWTGVNVERFRLHVRSQTDGSSDGGDRKSPAVCGSTSHRRRQNKQRYRQSGDSNKARASETASAEAWTFVRMGEADVWDISVAGDESYVAGGLIHHNSSRGVQTHNLPRDTVGDAEEPEAIEIIKGDAA